jgi:hypothetical protein
MPSPSTRRLAIWFGSWPFRYILLCSPLGSVVGWFWGFVYWCFFAFFASLLCVL